MIGAEANSRESMAGDDEKATLYRERAAEVRANAESMTLPAAKRMALEVAADYERLANTLDANARRSGR
jgi:hypothetical protein